MVSAAMSNWSDFAFVKVIKISREKYDVGYVKISTKENYNHVDSFLLTNNINKNKLYSKY